MQTDNHTIKTATAAQIFSLVAIAATVFVAALLTCERVLRALIRRSKAHAPGAGLSSETTDALPKAKTIAADADEDDLGLIGRARKSAFEAFAMPKGFREEMLAKTHHEAAHVAANEDEDEPAAPVGRARNSVFDMFALPDLQNLREKVAAKVTHEAKATEADGDRHSDGMVRMGTQRKSVFEMFAIDMPSLRGKVAAKKTPPAKRTRADKNSVYSGSDEPPSPMRALAEEQEELRMPSLAETDE